MFATHSRLVLGVAGILVAFLSTGCAGGPAISTTPGPSLPPADKPVEPFADLAGWLDDWIENEAVVGAVALVATPVGTNSAAAGWSDRETEAAISEDDGLRIGSITKMFTAVLVLDLVADGTLALDDPVAAYLPNAPAGVTIGQLLDHTSGLTDPESVASFQDILLGGSDPLAPAEAMEEAFASASAAGARQQYSNVNYLALGAVIEAATGNSYADVLRDRILGPLHLDDTGLEGIDPQPPTSYERPGPNQPHLSLADLPTADVIAASWSAGGLESTGEDLVTFAEALFGGTIVSPSLVTEMMDGWIGPRSGYGLGIATYSINGQSVFGHNGRTVGFAASLRHEPLRGITVVVLSNDGSAPTAEAADKLMDLALAG